MRFLVDECTGPKVAEYLRGLGPEVFSVYDEARGADDSEIIRKAFDEAWILPRMTKTLAKRSIGIACRIEASFSCVLPMSAPATR